MNNYHYFILKYSFIIKNSMCQLFFQNTDNPSDNFNYFKIALKL